MTLLVALTLMALVPSVLFHGVNQLLSNAFYAMNRVKVPAIVMPLGTLLYVAAAVPLSKMLGVQGLAIATSVSTGLIFAGLLVAFTRVLENFRLAWTAMNLLSYTALAGVALVAADALLAGLELPRLLYAGASLPLGGLFYLVALALLGDKTLLRLRDYARGIVADGAAA
jgi:putative peptidoglycan lipid II flippase